MWPNPQFPADLVTFTEKVLNEKLHFSYSAVLNHNLDMRYSSGYLNPPLF